MSFLLLACTCEETCESVLQPNLRWLGLGGQTVKILPWLACKFDLDQNERKSSQVNASARQAWPNGVASRRKFSTCESVWPGLYTTYLLFFAVLKYWQYYRSDFIEDNAQIQNEIIWNNSNILINKSTIFFKQWYQNGIILLQGLLDVDCTFLSLQKFQQNLRLHIPLITYYGLLNSIRASWRRNFKFTDSPNQPIWLRLSQPYCAFQ